MGWFVSRKVGNAMICSSIFLEGKPHTQTFSQFFRLNKSPDCLLSRAPSCLFFFRMGVPTPSFVNAGDGLFTHPIGEFVRASRSQSDAGEFLSSVRTNLGDMVSF